MVYSVWSTNVVDQTMRDVCTDAAREAGADEIITYLSESRSHHLIFAFWFDLKDPHKVADIIREMPPIMGFRHKIEDSRSVKWSRDHFRQKAEEQAQRDEAYESARAYWEAQSMIDPATA